MSHRRADDVGRNLFLLRSPYHARRRRASVGAHNVHAIMLCFNVSLAIDVQLHPKEKERNAATLLSTSRMSCSNKKP